MNQNTAEPPYVLPRYRTVVAPEWIDPNNHLAVPYYHVIMNDAAWHASESWDYGVDYRTRTGQTTFVVEMHLRYLRELKLGDPVAATVRILGLDDKRLHVGYEVFHDGEGYLAAMGEGLAICVDTRTRRTAPFESTLRERLTKIFDTHRTLPPLPEPSLLRISPAGFERAALDNRP